jgi:hypothetical protein
MGIPLSTLVTAIVKCHSAAETLGYISHSSLVSYSLKHLEEERGLVSHGARLIIIQ